MSNTGGKIAILLDPEQVGFLLHNCAVNHSIGLKFIMASERRTAAVDKVIALNEYFTGVRQSLIRACKDSGIDYTILEESYGG